MRNLKLLLLIPIFISIMACQDNRRDNRANPNTPSTQNTDQVGRNAADRGMGQQPPIAGDQSESESDRVISQKVRQALTRDNALSTNAKNIKVTTIRGVVTLRGPANNENEKTAIERKVRGIEGVEEVVNRLEIIR